MRVSGFLAPVLAFLASPAVADEAGTAGTPEVVAVFTAAPDGSIEDPWTMVPSLQKGFRVPVASDAVPLQTVRLRLFLPCRKISAEGKADFRMDIRFLKPDGSVYFEQKDVEVWHGPAATGSLLMSPRVLQVHFEENDPPGEYVARITVRDRVAEVSADVETRIRLAPFRRTNTIWTDPEFGEWVDSYFLRQAPNEAVDALFFVAHSRIAKNPQFLTPMIAFFAQLLDDHPHLVGLFSTLYPEQDEATRRVILSVVANMQSGPAAAERFEKTLQDEDLKALELIRKNPLLAGEQEITLPSHLDILWARFFATGRMAPIARIVGVLAPGNKVDPEVLKKEIEAYRKAGKPADARLMGYLVYGAAEWSVSSNCRQHDLVKGYCQALAEGKGAPEGVRNKLKEILSGD